MSINADFLETNGLFRFRMAAVGEAEASNAGEQLARNSLPETHPDDEPGAAIRNEARRRSNSTLRTSPETIA
jgi:hypothetical protein